mmetsp:Transcript_15297/g.23703  ORF Transcript_15297/g.23703 Transcript_15297/m.23703 type:complete len:157 (-) Transcript_15297:228-698(-)
MYWHVGQFLLLQLPHILSQHHHFLSLKKNHRPSSSTSASCFGPVFADIDEKPRQYQPSFGSPSLSSSISITLSATFLKYAGEVVTPLIIDHTYIWPYSYGMSLGGELQYCIDFITQFTKLIFHLVKAIGAANQSICAGKVGSITLLLIGSFCRQKR